MAIIISQTASGFSHDETLESTGTQDKVKTGNAYTFTAIASTPDEEIGHILRSRELPQPGEFWHGMKCQRVSVSGVSPVRWRGKHTTKYTITADLEAVKTDPLELPPVVSWDAETEEVRAVFDAITGAPVMNSAGEPLVLTRPLTVIVLNVQRYYLASAFPPATIYQYTNTLNSGPFWGAPAGHAKMERISIVYEEHVPPKTPYLGKIRYAKVSFSVKFKFDPLSSTPWRADLLDYGNYCRSADGKKIVRALDPQGRPEEVKLDGKGNRLDKEKPGVYLPFNVYPAADFSPLGIDAEVLGY